MENVVDLLNNRTEETKIFHSESCKKRCKCHQSIFMNVALLFIVISFLFCFNCRFAVYFALKW